LDPLFTPRCQSAGSTLEVRRVDARSTEQERREVGLHLVVWQAANPAVRVDVLA
jgi:hypothetical protein